MPKVKFPYLRPTKFAVSTKFENKHKPNQITAGQIVKNFQVLLLPDELRDQVLKEAAERSLFVAISDRFNAHAPQMTTVIQHKKQRRKTGQLFLDVYSRLRRLYRQREKLDPGSEAFGQLDVKIQKGLAVLHRTSERYAGRANKPQKKPGPDSFRSRIGAVLNLIRKADNSPGEAQVSFGRMYNLDTFPTKDPASVDAESNLKKRGWKQGEDLISFRTPNVLWRQLEFGTGVFAKAGKRLVGPFKSDRGDGSWYNGPYLNYGTKPGNFLRMATMALYNSDAVSFDRMFAELMHKRLAARR